MTPAEILLPFDAFWNGGTLFGYCVEILVLFALGLLDAGFLLQRKEETFIAFRDFSALLGFCAEEMSFLALLDIQADVFAPAEIFLAINAIGNIDAFLSSDPKVLVLGARWDFQAFLFLD